MKLYIANGSTACRKVLATAYHLDIPLELQIIEFFSAQFDPIVFARKNPNGMVPLLADGDFLLWESTAIMQYLADTISDCTLYPRDIKTRADISRWQCWALAHFGATCNMIIWENVLKPRLLGESPDPRKVEEGRQGFFRFGSVLAEHLQDKRFIVDDQLTLADFSVAATLGYAESAQIPWDEFPAIQTWYASLASLPAWKRSAPEV